MTIGPRDGLDGSSESRPARPRVALVTGASRGLGLVIVRFLAGQRFALILNARSAEPLEEARRIVEGLGARAVAVAGDVREDRTRENLLATVRSLGRLDLLVNDASDLGASPRPKLREYPLGRLREVFETNVFAPLALVQLLLPFLASSRGLVVNISSDAAVEAYPGWGGYGASKSALDLVSRTLARELEGDGVSVVSVDPGDMRTKMQQDAFPGEDISDRPPPDVTIPFWGWLLGQPAAAVSGGRYRAQADAWIVAR